MSKIKKPSPSKYAPKSSEVIYQKFSRTNSSTLKQQINPVVTQNSIREDAVNVNKIKSLSTKGGNTASKDTTVYSGTEMIGISVIHKSCLQPIFSSQEAKDVAAMRR